MEIQILFKGKFASKLEELLRLGDYDREDEFFIIDDRSASALIIDMLYILGKEKLEEICREAKEVIEEGEN